MASQLFPFLLISLWSYLLDSGLKERLSHSLSSSGDHSSSTASSHPCFSISWCFTVIWFLLHLYCACGPYLCVVVCVFNLKQRLCSVRLSRSQATFCEWESVAIIRQTVYGFHIRFRDKKKKKKLYMMFPLRQHCLWDKGDGQNLLIKTKRGRKWAAHTHTHAPNYPSPVRPLREKWSDVWIWANIWKRKKRLPDVLYCSCERDLVTVAKIWSGVHHPGRLLSIST